MDKIIGIDIGGTKIAIGRADINGNLEDFPVIERINDTGVIYG